MRFIMFALAFVLVVLGGCAGSARTDFTPATSKAAVERITQPETTTNEKRTVIRIGGAAQVKEQSNGQGEGGDGGGAGGGGVPVGPDSRGGNPKEGLR
jgi:hypothetical protein